MKYGTILLAFFIFTQTSTVGAQQYLGKNPIIGGATLSCFGADTYVSNINDLAKALPGQIILSPILSNYHPIIQIFVYMHECGHQVVGSNEAAADCWAIKVGRDQGWLPPAATGLLVQAFGNSPGDWTHAPGPYRIQQMAACYNNP